jgi:L-glyceraldehyde 3-phosphate reductase
MLTDKYLAGGPDGSRASRDGSFSPRLLTDDAMGRIEALNAIARARGQSLAQMALAWALRDPRVTSLVFGVSSVAQLEDGIAALGRRDFTADELAAIDRHAVDSGIDIWAESKRV